MVIIKEWAKVYWFWLQVLCNPTKLRAFYAQQFVEAPKPVADIPPIIVAPIIDISNPNRVHLYFVGSDYGLHSSRTAVKDALLNYYIRSFNQTKLAYQLDSQYEDNYIYRTTHVY